MGRKGSIVSHASLPATTDVRFKRGVRIILLCYHFTTYYSTQRTLKLDATSLFLQLFISLFLYFTYYLLYIFMDKFIAPSTL